MNIKILRGCGASGQSLDAGQVYSVPEEVSQSDARILVNLGKAQYVTETDEPEKVDKRRKKAR